MPFASSLANSEDRRSSSTSSCATSSGGPLPGMELGGASTRVFVRGRFVNVEVAAVGGGADGVSLDVNSSRTSAIGIEIGFRGRGF